MYKIIISLGFLGLLTPTFSQGINHNVQLTGQIEGMGNSKLYVGRVSDYFLNYSIVDSFDCRNDTFNFESNFQVNSNLYCLRDDMGRFLYFTPDNETICFDGHRQEFLVTSISGSESNELMSEFWQLSFSTGKEIAPLYSSLTKAKKENNLLEVDSIKSKIDSLNSIMRALPESFIQENSQSTASAAILFIHLSQFMTDISNQLMTDIPKLKRLYSSLDKHVQESPSGKRVKEFIKTSEDCGLGKPFIDSELITDENEIIKISSLKGNYFLMEFWTTWCGPCRAELPYLLQAHEKYHANGFEILSISLDHSKETWMNVIEEQNAPWIHTTISGEEESNKYDPFESEIAKAYAVLGVPSNYLINPDGIIIASGLRRNVLLEKLAEIYAE